MDFDKNKLPDLTAIEQLANQFFKALPGEKVSPNLQDVKQADQVLEHTKVNQDHEKLFPSDQKGVDYSKPFDRETYEKNPQSYADNKSKATSHDYPYQFNIQDPQTSHPDPHFYDGKIPKSVAGIGKKESGNHNTTANQTGKSFDRNNHSLSGDNFLPFQNFAGHDPGIQHAVQNVKPQIPTHQIPLVSFPGTSESSFYFLGKNVPHNLPSGREFNEFTKGVFTSSADGFVRPSFDLNIVKRDFPILNQKVNGKPLIWFDNAATTQKPKLVIDRVAHFYQYENSNVHRAAHELAARSTDAYETAREKVQKFINARSINEIIFVRGTTEAINLIANTWGDQNLKEGDEIILSNLEHHANIVPWQLLAKKKGFLIKVIPVNDHGELLLDEYGKLLNSKTKLVSFTHVSNALGTITPAKTIIEMAHAQGAKVLLDGAQSVSHMRVDMQHLNPDFFVFSGHKVFGPTGIGVVYGKEHILNELPPYQGGGNMIKDVTFEHTEFHDSPGRFEAGTGNIADAVGLGAALDYVNKIGIDAIGQYEHGLLAYATRLVKQIPGLKIIGTAKDKASVLSFTLQGYTNDEVGQILNKEGIAVRTGHHCAQPILRRFGLESTVRPSLAFYNSCAEVDTMVSILHKLADSKKKIY